MIHVSLPHYLSQFSVPGEENEGNLCSKNVLMSSYPTSILRTLPNLICVLPLTKGFYFSNINNGCHARNKVISQVNSYESLWPASPILTEHLKHIHPHFSPNLLFWGTLYIYMYVCVYVPMYMYVCMLYQSARHRWSRFLSFLLIKRLILVRIQVQLKNNNPEILVRFLCDTSPGWHLQFRKAPQIKQAGYFQFITFSLAIEVNIHT